MKASTYFLKNCLWASTLTVKKNFFYLDNERIDRDSLGLRIMEWITKKTNRYDEDVRTKRNRKDLIDEIFDTLTKQQTPPPPKIKRKQDLIEEEIRKIFPDLNWISDRPFGKSRHRPDLLLDLPSHYLIIEIDEMGHRDYTEKAEIRRNRLLREQAKGKPIYMIRFNPDEFYEETKGSRRQLTFPACIVNGEFTDEWNERFPQLIEEIEIGMECPNVDFEEIFLYI